MKVQLFCECHWEAPAAGQGGMPGYGVSSTASAPGSHVIQAQESTGERRLDWNPPPSPRNVQGRGGLNSTRGRWRGLHTRKAWPEYTKTPRDLGVCLRRLGSVLCGMKQAPKAGLTAPSCHLSVPLAPGPLTATHTPFFDLQNAEQL